MEGLVLESTVYNVTKEMPKPSFSQHLKEIGHLEKNYSSESRVRHEEAEIDLQHECCSHVQKCSHGQG